MTQHLCDIISQSPLEDNSGERGLQNTLWAISFLDTPDQRDHSESQSKPSVWNILYFALSHDNTSRTITLHLSSWPPIWLRPPDLGPSCLTEEMPFPVWWEDMQRWLVCSQLHASLGGLACQPWKQQELLKWLGHFCFIEITVFSQHPHSAGKHWSVASAGPWPHLPNWNGQASKTKCINPF